MTDTLCLNIPTLASSTTHSTSVSSATLSVVRKPSTPNAIAKRKRKEWNNYDGLRLTEQYSYRAHEAVLQKSFAAALPAKRQAIEQQKSRLQKEIDDLKVWLDVEQQNPQRTLNEWRIQQKAYKNAQQQLVRLDGEIDAFQRQCKLLRYGKLSSLVQAGRLLNWEPEIYTVDESRCEKCGEPFTYKGQINRNICKLCTRICKPSSVPEDSSIDLLVIKSGGTSIGGGSSSANSNSCSSSSSGSPDTTLGHHLPSPLPGEKPKKDKKPVNPVVVAQKQAQRQAKTLQEYRLFFLQFEHSKPPVPNEVLDFVHRQLSMVKYMGQGAFKETAVQKNLAKSTQWAEEWQTQSERVTRTLNQEPIPKLTMDLIDLLMLRFESLTIHATKDDNKKILIADKNVVAALLLRTCLQDELARHFALPKTSTVLDQTNHRLLTLAARARRADPDRWKDSVLQSLV